MAHHLNPHRGRDSFCRRTRREFLWQTGAGFGAVALSDLLSRDGFLSTQTMAADGVTPYRNPLAAKPPHFRSQSQVGHLSVHVWRSKPYRYL